VEARRVQLERALDAVRAEGTLWTPDAIRSWRANWRLMGNEMNRQNVCDGRMHWDDELERAVCRGEVRSYASWVARQARKKRRG